MLKRIILSIVSLTLLLSVQNLVNETHACQDDVCKKPLVNLSGQLERENLRLWRH